jgi:ribosomal protein S18 acetylase RimI-like enzyme
MEILPADQFTLEQLTEAYNQTRVDYIVPMPMNVDTLREYNRVYDISLAGSCVAIHEGEIIGLGMLGLREQRSWITRLGVLPSGRQHGLGRALMDFMLTVSQKHGVPTAWLEVIKGNDPAHNLFRRCGFIETRELLVTRRPPTRRQDNTLFNPSELLHLRTHNQDVALEFLQQRQEWPAWTNQTESFANVPNLTLIEIQLKDGSVGWVAYHASLLRLTRIVVGVLVGDPMEVTTAVLHTLHRLHPTQDALAENIPADDPKWPGFQKMGYFETFRRVEMVKHF